MSQNRRVLTYLVIALIVGAALALAVAVASSNSSAAGSQGGSTEIGVTSITSDDGTAPLAAADPAKDQPLLDEFTSKDPFIPLPASVASTSSGGTSTGTPSPTPSSSSTPSSNLSAKVKVDGTTFNVVVGDKVPGGSAAAFKVTSVTSSDVTFSVIDGKLENGDTSFTVNVGEAVHVTLESGVGYDITVASVGSATGGGGNGSGGSSTTTTGHSISVLSISSQNGKALVTLKVDGKTYSDLKTGEVITTSFGQIKIVSINVSAQTVVIMHGDQTFTLHAGQVVIK